MSSIAIGVGSELQQVGNGAIFTASQAPATVHAHALNTIEHDIGGCINVATAGGPIQGFPGDMVVPTGINIINNHCSGKANVGKLFFTALPSGATQSGNTWVAI